MLPDREPDSRARLPAGALAAAAIGYLAVTVLYFWADWFQYFRFGQAIWVQPDGLAIPVTRCTATLLSPWRLLLAGLTAFLLGRSALQLARRAPGSRALALATLWGVLLPQVFWYTEFVLDWRGGRDLATVLAVGLFAAAAPTALVWRDDRTLDDWGNLQRSHLRLLGAIVALGWLGFGAMELLDHAHQFGSRTALFAALAAVPLCGVAMTGLYRQRTWALPVAVAAAAAVATVPISLWGAPYLPDARAMDVMHDAISGPLPNAIVASSVPVVAVAGLLAPFLYGLVRRR